MALESGETLKIFTNKMCDMSRYVDFDPREKCGIKERVRYDVLQELLGQYSGEELIAQCRLHADDLAPKHIIVDDIFASINYMNALAHGLVTKDDIDHLGNRRLRCVDVYKRQLVDRDRRQGSQSLRYLAHQLPGALMSRSGDLHQREALSLIHISPPAV